MSNYQDRISFPSMNNDGFTTLDRRDFITTIETIESKYPIVFKGFSTYNPVKVAEEQLSSEVNYTIRASHVQGPAVNKLASSFMAQGYNTSAFPPIMDTEGRLREGRNRTLAFDQANIKEAPVAIFGWNDSVSEEEKGDFDFLINTTHLPQNMYDRKDFVYRGWNKVKNGEMHGDRGTVEDWVRTKSGATEYFSDNNGDLTKITTDIMRHVRASEAGESPSEQWGRQQAENWIKDNVVLDEPVVSFIATKQYASKAWCYEMMPKMNDDVISVVLYTNQPIHSECKKQLRECLTALDEFHADMVSSVSAGLTAINLDPKAVQRRFKICGVVPQNPTYHKWFMEEGQLVPVDVYLDD